MISIKSIMKKDFSKLSSSESVGSAVKVMEKMDVDYSVVEEEGEIKGVVTSRELVGYPSSRLLLDCTIQPVRTIREKALADEALRVLEEGKASFIVVLNAEGTPTGVTNRQAIIDSLFQELEKLNGEKDKYIAELRQAEEALRLSKESFNNIVNRNVDGVLIIDRKGIVHFVNPAAEALFGRKADKLLGEMFGLPVVVGDVSEIDTIHASGKLGVAEMRVIETEWEGESAYLASVRDITERKQAQQAQERLSQQLQAKVSELEAFSYGIAHDLRSPMLSIEGFSRELRADIQNQKMERVQEDIRLLESGVKKMQQFLNRTLEYSRAGNLVKLTKNVPFGKIVEDVITGFAEQVRSIGATVSLAETFPKVDVDEIRMREVLTNLIQNSIKYRDEVRPLTIEIGYWLSGDEVVFFVRDNGAGIDSSEAEKVFELFYRGATDGEGSGAGLAIVKRIIEAHGGRVWAESQPGKGTTMCFTLPQQSNTNKGDNNGKD
jgi:signal transduction histidine kinase